MHRFQKYTPTLLWVSTLIFASLVLSVGIPCGRSGVFQFAQMAEEKRRVAFDIERLKISDITVYVDRAEVKRKLDFSVDTAGRTEVLLERMSPMLDESSVRIEGFEPVEISDTKVQKRSGHEDPVWRAKAEDLRNSLQDAMARDRQLNGELNRAKEQRSIFETAVQTRAGQVPLDDAPKFLAKYFDRLKKMDDAISLLQAQYSEMHKATKALKSELDQMETDDARWSVLIVMEIAQPGRVELKLSYAVSGVSWSADYAMRVDSNERKLNLIYRGLVRQRTGEDWSQIEMRLVSSRYGIECGRAATLGRWKAVLAEERKVPIATAGTSSAMGTLSEATSGSSPAVLTIEERSVDVELESDEGAAQCTFDCFCESIPSDGELHRVILHTQMLTVEILHECIPSRARYAFAKASTVNKTGFPLLPGRVTVFMDNSLVASSAISRTVNSNERFECALGPDPAVNVEYKQTSATYNDSITGFFSRAVSSTTFEQRTTVKNSKRNPIVLKLTDVLPNCEEDGVKVILNEPNMDLVYKQTSGVTHFQEGNCLIYDVFVAPGKDARVVTKYTIQYPAGKSIKLTEASM